MRSVLAAVGLVAGLITFAPAASGSSQGPELVSAGPGGQGNNYNQGPSISGDGRLVAFWSSADLVPEDRNGREDVYVHDRVSHTTTLVSVNQSGLAAGNDGSFYPAISSNGRWVSFTSRASDLTGDPIDGTAVFVRDLHSDTTELVSSLFVAGAAYGSSISGDGRFVAFSAYILNSLSTTGGDWRLFVTDRDANTTTLVSHDPSGNPVIGDSGWSSISDDGLYLAFQSQSSDLVPGHEEGTRIFVWDRMADTIELVTPDVGSIDYHFEHEPSISANGRFVIVPSDGPLLSSDTNGLPDIYLRDRLTGSFEMVSLDRWGAPPTTGSRTTAAISGDGRFVAFSSDHGDITNDDPGYYSQMYVRELATGTTELVSKTAAGDPGTEGGSYDPSLTYDGGLVAYSSFATNFLSPDTNSTYPDIFVSRTSTPPAIGISNVSPVATSVGRYDMFEASFDLDRSYANPFDPNEIRVDVTFTSPSGQDSVVPAFWFQDFTATVNGSGNEDYAPTGTAGWRVRFAPSEVGTYTYSIDAQDGSASGTSGPMTFTATPSAEHGFVRLDPSDPRYMRYDDGTPYLPRGHNAAFEDREPFQGGLSVYRPLFDSFAAAHENWTRVWMTDFNRSAIEWSSGHWSGLYGGAGVYSLASAWRWDKMLDRAAADGLEVQMVFNDHGQFSSPGSNPRWDENPYNAANGGPVPADHPERFFTDQAAKDLYKQRLRYIVARWGAYPDVLAWELFNEIQFLGSAGSNPLNDPQMAADVQAWHIEMATYLKSIDPFQHLVTTSSDAPGLTAPIWSDPHVDLVQVHDYGGPPMSRFAQTIETLRSTYDKPVIYGEFGLGSGDPEAGFDPTTFGGSTTNLHHLQQATHLRNAVWTSALAGSGAMSWWWGNYIAADPSHSRTGPDFPVNERIFPALDAFMGDLDIVGLGLHASQVTPSNGLFAVGMNNATKAFAWIQDVDSEYGSGVDPANADVTGGTLEIGGMQDGDYTADVYATSGPGGVVASFPASVVGGTLRLDLPDFLGDIAVKVRPGPPRRPTNVVAAGGDGQAAVTWSPPATSPPGTIAGYSVTPRDLTLAVDLAPVTVTGTDVAVTGLTNGHDYSFTVTASNTVGTGPASPPSNEVTPASGATTPTATSGSTTDVTGGTVTTDSGSGATAQDPVTTSVAVPPGTGEGTVSIAEGTVTQTAPAGYQFLSTQINIVSTAATDADHPMAITFTIDGSLLNGETPATLAVLRTENGGTPTPVPPCTAVPPATLSPDPCIPTSSRIWWPDPVTGPDVRFTVLTSSASEWNISPVPATAVSVSDTGYAPKTAQAIQAQRVLWSFQSTKAHSVTDTIGLGAKKAPLFDSGKKTVGTFLYRFAAAGTYSYGSTAAGDSSFAGSIGVPMQTAVSSTPINTGVRLTWSSSALAGFVFDVQYRFKAAGSTKWSGWTSWQKAVTTTSATFTPTKRGTYAFGSRLRNASTGRSSLYSPDLVITAT